MRVRALIVDDEPLAREGVTIALRDEKDVEVVDSCPDGKSAVRAIRVLHPDLVFLDIKMPGLDGFQVIEEVGAENMPAVIFLTAYEEHALRAFRVNAVDYLLKPFDSNEFRDSLNRARRRLAEEDVLRWGDRLRGLIASVRDTGRASCDSPDRILVRTGGRVHLLDPQEIDWVEASGDYVTIHTSRKTHLLRESMNSMEARLATYGFQRIHRSALVKLTSIRELVTKESGDYQVVLHEGTVLRLSRTYRDALYAALNAAP